jgi:hypothetical protein
MAGNDGEFGPLEQGQWGEQSCPQPPFRRLFLAMGEPSCPASAG